MTVVIGVDGGGTRTRAVLVDAEGRELARGEASGAVVTTHEPEAAANAVWQAIEAAFSAAERSGPADVLWAGLAGAGRDDARAAVEDALARTRVARTIIVGTDAEAAFHDAFGDGPGVMVVAGTGSIAWARRPDGTMVRVGGWGQDIGDEGSGLRIGVEALRCVARAEDGRDPPTSMRDPILEHLGLAEPIELVTWLGGSVKGDLAALVPFVTRAADGGDVAASRVLANAVEGLVEHLTALLDKSGPWPEPPRLALWGGLVKAGGPLRTGLAAAAADRELELVQRELDPPLGAARLALAHGLSNRQ